MPSTLNKSYIAHSFLFAIFVLYLLGIIMTNMKNWIKIFLIILLCGSIGATSVVNARTKKKKRHTTETVYKDGTWSGKGSGYMGMVAVDVTVKRGKITHVEVTSNEDTPQYMNKAIKGVTQAIISKQNSKVDGVTGATYSSDGIKQAVANALAKAKK